MSDAGAMYLARGWPLLLCHARSKEPIGKLFPHGAHSATTDPEVIARGLRQFPDANLAVACGAPGPQVLDIDNPGAVPAAVAAAVMKAPRTASARGGAAFFEGTDQGTINLGWGELRGRGSYQMIPPSVHPTGKEYVWLEEPRGKLPPAPVVETHGQHAGSGEHKPPPRPITAGEGRHPYMKDYAVRILRAGITDQARIAAHLEREFELSCEPEPPPERGYFQILAKWAAESDIAHRENGRVASGVHELLIDMEAAMAQADQPIPYVVDQFMARGFLTVLAARHSSYKSWLMMMAAYAVERGASFAGIDCKPDVALYVDAENGARLMARRFRLAGIPADAIAVADGAKLSLPKDIARLGELIEYTNAGFVVLDSLRRLAPGVKENDSDSMAPIVAAIANLAREHNAAIGLIHHRSSKDGAAAVRGSSAIEDQADLVFGLERTGDACCLKPIKFRIDEEPATRWLRFVRDDIGAHFEGSEPVRSDREAKRDDRVRAVLDALTDDVQSERELAGETGIPKTTVRRILFDLEREGRAEQRSGGWVVHWSKPIGSGPVDHPLWGDD